MNHYVSLQIPYRQIFDSNLDCERNWELLLARFLSHYPTFFPPIFNLINKCVWLYFSQSISYNQTKGLGILKLLPKIG
jgi:hypothetical protein